MTRPNFFIVGAMKSGTTSLHAALGTHPDVFMCSPKEPSHFVERSQLKEIWPFMESLGFHDEQRYLDLFREAGGAKIRGESSANYSKLNRITGVAERIARSAPDAKLLYLMRDPIPRTISHYWHHVNFHDEHRPMLRAIKRDPQYMEVSYYAMQLRAFHKYFDPSQIFTLTTEELAENQHSAFQAIFEWLGVDDTFFPPTTGERLNKTPPTLIQPKGVGLLNRVRRSGAWVKLSPVVPSGLRVAGRGLAEKAVAPAEFDTSKVADYLRPIQRAQTSELTKLLGREFPEWTTLYADHGSQPYSRVLSTTSGLPNE